MLRAASTGTAQSTALVMFVRTVRPGLVIYAPVYRPGGERTLEDVAGMAVGSFTVADARAAVRGVVASGTAVRVRIDGADAFATGPVDPASAHSSFVFAGRTWTVQTRTAGFREATRAALDRQSLRRIDGNGSAKLPAQGE